MFRFCSLTAMVVVIGTAYAEAAPTKFRLQKGQVLTYQLVQITKITETLIDEKSSKPVDQELYTRNSVMRKWTVTDVDAQGVATLEMSIISMQWEQKLPNGETDLFDSEKPDDLNKKEMARLVGTVQAIVRIDAQGHLVEVKKGNANRVAGDLPFKMSLPDEELKNGLAWERKYTIKLDPPAGTGETYDATQKYLSKGVVDGFQVVGITTAIKDMPMQPSDQIPLLPMLTEGNIYFEPKAGIYHAARFKLKKELLNHAGEGTKYVYESSYSEDYKGNK